MHQSQHGNVPSHFVVLVSLQVVLTILFSFYSSCLCIIPFFTPLANSCIVELYLQFVIKPFLEFHDIFYASLNKFFRSQLDNASRVPEWFTANFITYLRTALVFPTLFMLSWKWWVPVSITIILVDFGDFLDGVVARYWVDMKKAAKKKKDDDAKAKVDSDDDSFGK